MKALVYHGPFSVSVDDVPDARIEDPTDAVVRITTTNICGSDLHMYEGRTDVEDGKVLGHENMGVVEAVGAGVVGVYVPEDPGASNDLAKEGKLAFDFGTFFFKGQSMGTGQCNTKQYNAPLRDLITEGRATPGFLVSHELGLGRAADGYDHFDKREDGWTTVVLHPGD